MTDWFWPNLNNQFCYQKQ